MKSKAHTYLNVQTDAHSKVGKKIEKRRELRRTRRSRSCPNRKNRTNRHPVLNDSISLTKNAFVVAQFIAPRTFKMSDISVMVFYFSELVLDVVEDGNVKIDALP